MLSLLVGVAGLSVLQTGVYRDLSVLSVCFAIAGSHYSLIKSVQPDAASPQHGFNRVIVYSRAIFFCLLALTFILTIRFHDKSFNNPYGFQSSLFLSTGLRTNELSLIDRSWFLSESPLLPIRAIPFRLPDPPEPPVHHSLDQPLQISHSADSPPYSIQVKLFGSAWSVEKLAHIVYTVTYRLLVIFPVLFLIGLVPQIDTALTYMLEQLDIHIFGGSGAVSLWSVCFSISRTLTAIVVSLWFCLAAIETGDPYHYLFSVFWALQVSLCFLLSRLPSNASLYATLFPCSVSGEQLGQQLRVLVSELFDFSCFSRITHKSAMQASSQRSKRRCRPRWPWSKSRKSKVDVVGVTREPVVWWRAWLPLLSNTGDPYHYLFSVFWALQVSLCFLLSRLPSNASLYATLFPCSVSGEQLGQQLRVLVSELFDFSCFSRITHKSAMQASSQRSKRRCRPRWPWSKSRKSKVDVVGVTREPVVWWRAWLPLLSNVGAKSASRLSEAQTTTTERLLRHPLQPVEDVPNTTAMFPVSLMSPSATRAYKSFSFNDLLRTGKCSPAMACFR
ncbi:Pecanex [Fasciolopsis buskii]|uniref:Pecanex-like protein n=1 Tax=Fasciolopsis buskii TaxID=27845 RepID=A0A8E0VLI3_9TREM|nr:Pecanex [Fasciolopsis buski]